MEDNRFSRDDVAAGIVTYNPDPVRLAENIAAIRPQVKCIIIVDNGSANRDDCLKQFSDSDDVRIIANDRNAGIAAALNQIMHAAVDGGYRWCVTLDQDSVSPDGMVDAYLAYDHLGDGDVGIMFPLRADRNRPDALPRHQGDYEVITSGLGPLTSGAMVNLKAWRDVNGFYEPLFIDYVDYDFNARLYRRGYKTVCENSRMLIHELGRCEDHAFMGKKVYTTNHSPIRRYYKARNALYFNHVFRGAAAVRRYRMHLIREMGKIVLFERDGLKKYAAVIRGMRDSGKFLKAHRDRQI